MAAVNSALFTGIAANWDAAITSGITSTINNEISANAVLFASILTFHIVISGFLMAFHAISAAELTGNMVKVGFIAFLLTAANFTPWVAQPLMTDIPNWIAQSANSQFNAQTDAQEFDALRNGVVAIEAGILQQATGWTQFGERIRAWVVTWFICMELAVMFIIWEAIKGFIGLMVASIPFVMGLFLFKTTRHVPLNVLGVIGAGLFLLLLASILLNISVNADQIWLSQSRAQGGSIDVQLDSMVNIFLFFLFGMAMSVFLPIVAGRIFHGVLPSTRAPAAGLQQLGSNVSNNLRNIGK